MKKETKDAIIVVGSTILTVGTSTLIGWMTGWGACALVNHVFKDGLTKSQLKGFGTITTIGSVGVSLVTAEKTLPKFTGIMQDIVDIFPTDAKEVNQDG